MNKILDVVEDIKQNITDNQYKTIMDSLMEIHKINNNGNLFVFFISIYDSIIVLYCLSVMFCFISSTTSKILFI
jgi:hypothetical protein